LAAYFSRPLLRASQGLPRRAIPWVILAALPGSLILVAVSLPRSRAD
jgi:hypothetical protein